MIYCILYLSATTCLKYLNIPHHNYNFFTSLIKTYAAELTKMHRLSKSIEVMHKYWSTVKKPEDRNDNTIFASVNSTIARFKITHYITSACMKHSKPQPQPIFNVTMFDIKVII